MYVNVHVNVDMVGFVGIFMINVHVNVDMAGFVGIFMISRPASRIQLRVSLL